MVTEREQEILRMVSENPLVSQQEIASRFGITRSSVAVHISNLMKKGFIQGKGYVLQTRPYAAVVGGSNMDIGGRPAKKMVPRDSNPGHVFFSPGGVGRNIAHNLALLEEDVRFISVFGEDSMGAQLIESCRRAGIDITLAPVLPGGKSAVYLFLTAHTGEMELAVSDMEIYDRLTPDFLAARIDTINRARICIADTNLPAESLRYLAGHCAPPLFVDPVSTTKAQKINGLLPAIHTLKCNRVEAELLSGISITGESGLRRAAQLLMDKGLTQLVVTLSEQGAFCANRDGMFSLPCYPGKLVNSTGAGDAFTAALAHGFMQGWQLERAAKAGLAAASLTVSSADTINPGLSPAHIQMTINAPHPTK